MAQKKIKYRLKGHESFMPRDGWLNKGINAVALDADVFSKNMGADALGVGSNMAKAIRYWLKVCSITEDIRGKGTKLTAFGELVLHYDPYLEDTFTIWILHIMLSCAKEEATIWYLFFSCNYLEEFTMEELEQRLKEELRRYLNGEKFIERSAESDIHVLLQMYAKERQGDFDPEDKNISPFSALGLVRSDRKLYYKRQPDLYLLPCDAVYFNILMMMEKQEKPLYRDISQEKENKTSEFIGISMEKLFNGEMSPGKILQIGKSALNHYLDQLQEEGILTVNRTAGLDMVYLQRAFCEKWKAVENYYKKKNKTEKLTEQGAVSCLSC